ncbi:MAG: cysteine desulfurase family protein [Bdellovibrionales bacterium]
MKKNIYLDYHATTPVDPLVLEKMIPYFTENYGNAASQHPWGWVATDAVEKARLQVATAINAKEKEIIFTGGATEASNIALFGLFEKNKEQKNHIITTNIEHKSVLNVCKKLEKMGADLSILPVDSTGRVNLETLKKTIHSKTLFVSILYANNEIGAINPMKEIGAICKEHDVIFHTDAVQAIGKLALDVDDLNIDMLSLTAHKFYGPKGTGALYIRTKSPKIKIDPLIVGGGHEQGKRSGTLNVPGIVGLGESIELATKDILETQRKLSKLRDDIERMVLDTCSDLGIETVLNGPANEYKLANNLSFSFQSIDPARLHQGLRRVAFSTGSACTTASASPSHVLEGIGLATELARNTIRLSVGRFTDESEIEEFKKILPEALKLAKIN